MQALILAASLVAPSPREAGVLVVPDMSTFYRQYKFDPEGAFMAYRNGVVIERVEIDEGSQRGWMVRSGIHRLRFMGGSEEAKSVQGKTLRLLIKPQGIGSDGLFLDAWVVK